MATAPAAAQPQQYLSAEQFLRATKSKTVKVVTAKSYVDNGTTRDRMPQSGLGHVLYVTIQGTITVGGTVTSGTFANLPAPAPWSLIKRMRFGSNNAFNMRDLSGWSWYKWLRYRYGIDPQNTDSGALYSANTNLALGTVVTNRIVPGANIVAQAYTFNVCLPIPISYNECGELGLLVLQQNSTFYDLVIDWGQVSGGISATGGSNDMFTSLVGTSLTVTSTVTYNIGLDWFEMVPGIGNLISMFVNANDQAQTPLVNGDNVIKPPVNDYYTMFMMEIYNNSAPVAVANIQNLIFQHSGNVYDYQDDYLTKIGRSYFQHRLPGVDGVVDWDLGTRRGVIMRRDTIDAFDDMNITDLQLRFTIPSTLSITGNSGINLVMESLRYFKQS